MFSVLDLHRFLLLLSLPGVNYELWSNIQDLAMPEPPYLLLHWPNFLMWEIVIPSFQSKGAWPQSVFVGTLLPTPKCDKGLYFHAKVNHAYAHHTNLTNVSSMPLGFALLLVSLHALIYPSRHTVHVITL